MISVPGPGRRLQRVINLSNRKARVISECVRVLRPSGELCVSDLTIVEEDLPLARGADAPAAWAG